MNRKNIIYVILAIMIVPIIFGYPFLEFHYLFLLYMRGIIFYDIINIIKNPDKCISYIKYVISIATELLFICSGCCLDRYPYHLFIYVALTLIGIRLIIGIIEIKKKLGNERIKKDNNIGEIVK